MTQEQELLLSCRNSSLLSPTPGCERPEGKWLDPEHLTQPGTGQASVQTCGMKESWGPCRRPTPFPFLALHLPTTFRPGLCIQWPPSEKFVLGWLWQEIALAILLSSVPATSAPIVMMAFVMLLTLARGSDPPIFSYISLPLHRGNYLYFSKH